MTDGNDVASDTPAVMPEYDNNYSKFRSKYAGTRASGVRSPMDENAYFNTPQKSFFFLSDGGPTGGGNVLEQDTMRVSIMFSVAEIADTTVYPTDGSQVVTGEIDMSLNMQTDLSMTGVDNSGSVDLGSGDFEFSTDGDLIGSTTDAETWPVSLDLSQLAPQTTSDYVLLVPDINTLINNAAGSGNKPAVGIVLNRQNPAITILQKDWGPLVTCAWTAIGFGIASNFQLHVIQLTLRKWPSSGCSTQESPCTADASNTSPSPTPQSES